MKNNNFRYNDLVGIMFYDEDDNPTPATEMVNKAKSFGGDRSAAARYAARIRWGTSPSTTGENTYGLTTEFPVTVSESGQVIVQYESNRFRAPLASERGLPNAKALGETLKPDLDALRAVALPQTFDEINNHVLTAKKGLTSFHRIYDNSQGWVHPQSVNARDVLYRSANNIGINAFRTQNPDVIAVASKIEATLEAFAAQALTLREPLMAN
jgi:hypothetical protein